MSSSTGPSDSGIDVNERTALLDAGQQGQKKATPLPKLQISILLLALLVEPIAAQSIYPYINQLVSELDITGGDERKVGYYAGLIESLFFATQALTVLQWSRTSDRIGRKPVLLLGIFGLSLSMLCFGLSRTLLGLIISRCITGALNGNIGVMKSMMGELTDSTNIAQGFALMPVAWSLGATIGPMIGGVLEHPQHHFPTIFPGAFWSQFPYFLPSAVAAAFAVICFLTILFFLKETLPRQQTQEKSVSALDGEALNVPENAIDDSPVSMRSLFVPSVLIPVINYGCIATLEIAMFALQPLFYSTPIELGGLGFDPITIGLWMGTFGIVNGVVQTIIFPPLINKFGPKTIFRFCEACFIPIFALFPITNMIACQYGINRLVWFSLTCSLVLGIFVDMSFGCILMFITAAAPNKRSLGATNGLAQMTASIVRAIGPASSTSMFAYSIQHNLMGGYAVYAIFVTMGIFAMKIATKLPDKTA
ncbi:major facilitator superfamily domain-containing protein [Suillus clintonianus]|uniref:major facilitator superfamily domain-containing protein n=1 Tax=Suillus clintonianus TaxID=1904413 RepID=UPI001B883186|nr:major facilitator superfamily domain-containing protein [Suillus clintonianus]KAG2132983.1 major facilitator superfamily domain-containing protein [Suillus clintonianus]